MWTSAREATEWSTSSHCRRQTARYEVSAELWYQPIGYRWAQNLGAYDALETQRFVRYYNAMSRFSGFVLATDTAP